MVSKVVFDKFTVFDKLTLGFADGINVFVGENGTGKTHVMKAVYSACSVIDNRVDVDFGQKLKNVFLPNSIGRLVHRGVGRSKGKVTVYRTSEDAQQQHISCTISTLNKVEVKKSKWNEDRRSSAIFIPVKDMLANAPGFRSLYAEKHIHFEEVYSDIIDKALLPATRGRLSEQQNRLLNELNKVMSGRVIVKDEQFFLKNKSGELEFTLLAEGYRKLGLLYKLIQNEVLIKGSVLFWDEPEANLNPKLTATVVKILLELQRMGVQIFIATHDYVFLKELSLATTTDTPIKYFSLYRSAQGGVGCSETTNFDDIEKNPIDEAFDGLLNKEIERQLRNGQA